MTLTRRHRIAILLALFAAAVIGMAFVPPFPQDPAYHHFADTRPLWGIPNFGDVVSNAAFLVVGLLGLATILGTRRQAIFAEGPDATPYAIFFIGVGLVALGSAYYHLVPDTDRLFWDRLPMTVAFMALFAAIVADRIDRRFGNRWLLPILVAVGIASLLYWDWTEGQGRGDLRWYAMVQFYPMLALPVICWLFPKSRYTGGGQLIWVIVWYGIAKVLEHFDGPVLEILGGAVSGHSLKHLAAAMATYHVLRMVKGTPERVGH